MAITHQDLSVKTKTQREPKVIISKLALFLVVFSVLCGLTAFVLCLAAEGYRSKVTWLLVTSPEAQEYKCFYSGSGQIPLICAVVAFVVLTVAMIMEHACMLVAVARPWMPALESTATDFTWQACCLFLTTWICFGLAQVLLVVGMGVESGHLSKWASPRSGCHAMAPGVFTVAAVSALLTVILGISLYITALKAQKLQRQEESAQHDQGIRHQNQQHEKFSTSA